MKTKWAGRAHTACFVSLLILTSTSSFSQFVNEKPFPALPLNVTSAALYGGTTSALVLGQIGKSTAGLFDDWSGYSIPFIFRQDSIAQPLHAFVPDTNRYWYWGFGGTTDLPNYSLALDNNDNAILCWSKLFMELSDVPPTYLTPPVFRSALYSNGTLTNLFTLESALNPQVVYDKSNTAHFVWENVTPLDSFPPMYPWGGPLQKRFSKYSSEIFYRARTADGTLSTPVSLGKGFLPQIRLAFDNSVHVLWLGADSSSATIFQTLYRKKTGDSFSAVKLLRVLLSPYSRYAPSPRVLPSGWNVDSSNTLHYAWTARSGSYEAKFYVLHYNESTDISIDSSAGYLDDGAQFIFNPSGEIDAAWSSRATQGGPTQFFYSSSINGRLFSQVKTFSSAPGGSSFSLLEDYSGKIHAIFFGTNDVTVLKDLADGKDTLYSVYRGGTAGTSAYIDRNDKVWMIGKKDSLYSLLSFSLSDVGKYQNFTFPLQRGNLWQYAMYNIEAQPPADFLGYNQVLAERDTLMPNGKTYALLRSQNFREIAQRILRRDGLKVFQYSLHDTAEFLRYDFSKNKGDTVSVGPYNHLPPTTVQEIYTGLLFDAPRRQFRFFGAPFPGEIRATIADSVGIVQSGDGLSIEMILRGAIIDGVKYGTVLGVERERAPLPSVYLLYQNCPNPFNPTTEFRFTIGEFRFVSLKVYDVLGRELVTLMDEKKTAGSYTIRWDASRYPSGVYFYRLRAGGFAETKKMVLLR